MSNEREIKKQQEESLFDNRLAREFLLSGKIADLQYFLEMSGLRLKSGMTAEEIEAVEKRVKEAYNAHRA